ncbi:ATP-binding protein [Streptomyces griseocarneus]|uniref:ATP-binding protein n=1 Tax=Streptomyces griseocarneus TaxID=51201 RepID=UPI00167D47BE|nr:ATP-binding protein [Streptomyces griseocarneus]MBZ6477652.1 ATP-binding protein [Streptomyces griseocarneus]GHG82111.1 ATP-binding protein [Streptomyces griseocarneus]
MGTEGSTVLSPLWRGLPPIDSSAVSTSASCGLPPRFEAVGTARKFTRSTLGQWNLNGLFDEVALVVSELVTNSMRYAIPSDHRSVGTEYEPPVRLHLLRWTSRLVCAVRDPSEASPVAGQAGAGDECGRGLFLVEQFTDAWGWHPLAGALHGKVVWALFRLPRD